MTPVEEVKTRAARHAQRLGGARRRAPLDRGLARRGPVKALELPELTRIAAGPSGRPRRTLASQSRTGAERVLERVKVPAIVVPGASSASITSVRPL